MFTFRRQGYSRKHPQTPVFLGMSLSFCFIFLAALALLPQSAEAQYKELMHEGWHKHNDNFTVDGVVFKVKAVDEAKVVLDVKGNIFVMQNETCIDRINMSLCLNDVKYPSFELHKLFDPEEYEYYIEVWFYLANLSINKQIDEKNLLIGQKARVEVSIVNDGSLPAEGIYFRDVYFSDYYPDFFITNVIGCTASRHNVTWSGIIKPNQVKTCIYYLEAMKSTTFQSIAKATYLVGISNRTKTVSSALITLVVPEYELELKGDFNATSADVGENLDFDIVLNNTIVNRTFDSVALTIHIPEGLMLVEYSGGIYPLGNMLRWSGTVSESESKDFWARFKVIHSGNNTIRTNLNYKINHLVRIVDKLDSVQGLMDELGLQYISLPGEAESGSTAMLDVNVNNPSSSRIFKDVNVAISTNLPINFSHSYFPEIGRNQFRRILTRNITLPDVGDITHYMITFSINYKTEYGQEINLTERKTITVNPKKVTKITGVKGAVKEAEEISEGIVEQLAFFVAGVAEKLEYVVDKLTSIGSGKFMMIIVAVLSVIFLSLVYFIKKMISKVREYEQYERGNP